MRSRSLRTTNEQSCGRHECGPQRGGEHDDRTPEAARLPSQRLTSVTVARLDSPVTAAPGGRDIAGRDAAPLLRQKLQHVVLIERVLQEGREFPRRVLGGEAQIHELL